MKTYTTAIFDLDGTLLNTLDDLTDSVNHVMEQFGFPTHSTQEIRRFLGNGIRVLMEKAVPEGTDAGTFEHAIRGLSRLLYRPLCHQNRTLSRHGGGAAETETGGLSHCRSFQ